MNCSHCGKHVQIAKKFCTGCGKVLQKDNTIPPPPRPPSPPPQQFVRNYEQNKPVEEPRRRTTSQSPIVQNYEPASKTPPRQRQAVSRPAKPINNQSGTGELVISGNGKYNLSSLIYWGLSLVGDIVLLVIGLVYIPDFIAGAPRRAVAQIGGMTLSLDDLQLIATMLVVVGIVGLVIGIIFATLALRRMQSEIRVYERCIVGKTIQGFPPTLQEFNVPLEDVRNVDVIKQTGIVVHTQYASYTSYTKKAEEIRDVILSSIGS